MGEVRVPPELLRIQLGEQELDDMAHDGVEEEWTEHWRVRLIADELILRALIDELIEAKIVPTASIAARLAASAAEQTDLLPEVSMLLRLLRRELMAAANRSETSPQPRDRPGS